MFQLRLEASYTCRQIPFQIPFSVAEQSCLKNMILFLISFSLAQQSRPKTMIP